MHGKTQRKEKNFLSEDEQRKNSKQNIIRNPKNLSCAFTCVKSTNQNNDVAFYIVDITLPRNGGILR